MENKSKKKIQRDKNGREFIKEAYFVGGKMKFHRIYLIEGKPADEFYEKNATDLDFLINQDYHLMNSVNESNNFDTLQNYKESEANDYENLKDLPF